MPTQKFYFAALLRYSEQSNFKQKRGSKKLMKTVTTKANANIALIKYWGKQDERLFLPTKSSLSFTLPKLITTTTVSISSSDRDEVLINQKKNPAAEKNIIRFLDIFRKLHNIKDHFVVNSTNSFPTAAGLASSASGFAALARGLNELCKLNLSNKELSILARRGSGSACRSIHSGFVLWQKGKEACGSDSYAEKIFDSSHWPEFRILVAIVDKKAKKIKSRLGMQQTQLDDCYKEWIQKSEIRINEMITAIGQRDIDKVGKLAEEDCLEMHDCIKHADPPIDYWQEGTREIVQKIKKLRERGIPCYFTIDAGPNVKIITLEKYVETIKKELCVEIF